jgi:hypothetical protein
VASLLSSISWVSHRSSMPALMRSICWSTSRGDVETDLDHLLQVQLGTAGCVAHQVGAPEDVEQRVFVVGDEVVDVRESS